MARSEPFLNRCRWLRIATLLVFVGLALLLCLGAGSLPWRAESASVTEPRGMLLLSLVRVSPGLGYLWALWAVQRALADLAAGRLFHGTVARAIRHIGYGVLTGALLSVFAITNLSRMVLGGHGGFAYFDLSGIVLGVVGAALILLSQVVDAARRLQDELDEIL